jgi:hypothetical protein
MSELENRTNRREPLEIYRPGAMSEEREKHRRRAHFGENRVNNQQHQEQPHRNGDENGGGSRRGNPRGRGKDKS